MWWDEKFDEEKKNIIFFCLIKIFTLENSKTMRERKKERKRENALWQHEHKHEYDMT